MNKPPAFQFYADDFLAGTMNMSDAEVGLYIRLLCVQWTNGSIPNDDEEIRAYSKRGSVEPSLNRVKSKFEAGPDGMLRNQRMEAERMKQMAYRDRQSQFGRRSAEARFNRPSTNPQPTHQPKANSSSSSSSSSTEAGYKGCESVIPSWVDVKASAAMMGLAEWQAKDWFEEMESIGWLDYKHRKVTNWQAMLNRVKVKWEADGRPMVKPGKSVVGSKNGAVRRSALDIRTIIQAKERMAASIRTRHCSDTAMDSIWNDDQRKAEYFRLKREVKALTTELSEMA